MQIDSQSIYWICSDIDSGDIPVIATANEIFAQQENAEIIDDLFSGCYEGELFYLAGTDAYAWIDEDQQTVILNNHHQNLMAIAVDKNWIEAAKNAANFVWITGLSESDKLYPTIKNTKAETLQSWMWDDEIITLISVCVINNPDELTLSNKLFD
jgi:hypothetical protein